MQIIPTLSLLFLIKDYTPVFKFKTYFINYKQNIVVILNFKKKFVSFANSRKTCKKMFLIFVLNIKNWFNIFKKKDTVYSMIFVYSKYDIASFLIIQIFYYTYFLLYIFPIIYIFYSKLKATPFKKTLENLIVTY